MTTTCCYSLFVKRTSSVSVEQRSGQTRLPHNSSIWIHFTRSTFASLVVTPSVGKVAFSYRVSLWVWVTCTCVHGAHAGKVMINISVVKVNWGEAVDAKLQWQQNKLPMEKFSKIKLFRVKALIFITQPRHGEDNVTIMMAFFKLVWPWDKAY